MPTTEPRWAMPAMTEPKLVQQLPRRGPARSEMKKMVMRSTALKTMGPSEMTAMRKSELMLGLANDCAAEGVSDARRGEARARSDHAP